MRTIAKLSDKERSQLFRNTANKFCLADAIVEKDFWVCYTLDYLFHRCPYKAAFTFKGGTSLSKAYHLIDRFSEDIDLILDWRILGYSKDEPWENRSKTQQDKFNKEANHRTEEFLSQELIPVIKKDLSKEIYGNWSLSIDESDKQTILFSYPRLFFNPSTLQAIRLEIGSLSAWTPSNAIRIQPYVSLIYPSQFEEPDTEIITVAAERTFWEKATILHQEANRPETLPMPKRYSRHYYDLYRMTLSNVKEQALNQIALLQLVVKFKMKFYPRSWAKYEQAVPGSLILVPPNYRLKELTQDYEDMKDMIYGDRPSLDQIMATLKELEIEINSLSDEVL